MAQRQASLSIWSGWPPVKLGRKMRPCSMVANSTLQLLWLSGFWIYWVKWYWHFRQEFTSSCLSKIRINNKSGWGIMICDTFPRTLEPWCRVVSLSPAHLLCLCEKDKNSQISKKTQCHWPEGPSYWGSVGLQSYFVIINVIWASNPKYPKFC